MNYSDALEYLKRGGIVQRSGWNGKGMFLFMITNWTYKTHLPVSGYSNLPFIAMKTVDDKIVPWLCSQTDALADDWQSVLVVK